MNIVGGKVDHCKYLGSIVEKGGMLEVAGERVMKGRLQ